MLPDLVAEVLSLSVSNRVAAGKRLFPAQILVVACLSHSSCHDRNHQRGLQRYVVRLGQTHAHGRNPRSIAHFTLPPSSALRHSVQHQDPHGASPGWDQDQLQLLDGKVCCCRACVAVLRSSPANARPTRSLWPRFCRKWTRSTYMITYTGEVDESGYPHGCVCPGAAVAWQGASTRADGFLCTRDPGTASGMTPTATGRCFRGGGVMGCPVGPSGQLRQGLAQVRRLSDNFFRLLCDFGCAWRAEPGDDSVQGLCA